MREHPLEVNETKRFQQAMLVFPLTELIYSENIG